jgi:CheY-like chemotaxis protein
VARDLLTKGGREKGVNEQFPIIVAEDNERDAQLLNRALREVGFNNPVHVSRDGQDVINYLKGEPPYEDRTRYKFPRVLFIDLQMPVVDGFQLLEWLKRHDECNVIPRIVLSASRQQEHVQRAYRLGVNSYIYKPPTFDGLVERLQMVINYWSMCEMPVLPSKC